LGARVAWVGVGRLEEAEGVGDDERLRELGGRDVHGEAQLVRRAARNDVVVVRELTCSKQTLLANLVVF
jgi:hypothetical protein